VIRGLKIILIVAFKLLRRVVAALVFPRTVVKSIGPDGSHPVEVVLTSGANRIVVVVAKFINGRIRDVVRV
jgi:hypothetical protein